MKAVTMVLDHRATLHAVTQRPLLLAVTGLALAGVPAVAYAGIQSRISLNELLLAGVATLGLFIPPHWLVASMAPVWLLAPFSAEAFTIAYAATVALVLGLVLRFAARTRHMHRMIVWPAMFAAVLTLSLLYPALSGPTPLSPWDDLAGVLAGLAVAGSAIVAPPDPSVLAKTIATTGAAVAGVILVGGTQAAGRLVGAGLNPNYLGAMMALPCVAAIGIAWHARQPAWLVAAAPSAVALVQTESRGALVAVAAGTAYLVLRGRSWRQQALVVAALALLAALFGKTLVALLLDGRSVTELDTNNAIREQALRLALDVAAAHPLRGIGYGMFAPYAAAAPQIGIFINTHNEYTRLACEAGVPAAALFVVLLVLAMRGRPDRGAAVLRAVVVVYAAVLVFGNFMSNMFVSMPFWIALGCLLGGDPHRAGADRPGTHRA